MRQIKALLGTHKPRNRIKICQLLGWKLTRNFNKLEISEISAISNLNFFNDSNPNDPSHRKVIND